MTIQELHNQIMDKHITDNLFIFIGPEYFVQHVYIEKIAQIKNLNIKYTDDFNSIQASLDSSSLFKEYNLYVIQDDMELLKHERVWKEINPGKNIIIFKYSSLVKNSKFLNYFSEKSIIFEKLSQNVLINRLKPTGLSIDNIKKLIEIGDNNYGQILLELDKVKQAANGSNNLDYYFITLDAQGAFHKNISDITFDFIDYLVTRDIQNSLKLYQQLKQIGESNIKLLSLLYTTFKVILLIQTCHTSDICESTGIQYYQLKMNQNKIGYYGVQELVFILKLIQKIDTNIKQGNMEETISIDYLLSNIL